jgi:hypothetical protein
MFTTEVAEEHETYILCPIHFLSKKLAVFKTNKIE